MPYAQLASHWRRSLLDPRHSLIESARYRRFKACHLPSFTQVQAYCPCRFSEGYAHDCARLQADNSARGEFRKRKNRLAVVRHMAPIGTDVFPLLSDRLGKRLSWPVLAVFLALHSTSCRCHLSCHRHKCIFRGLPTSVTRLRPIPGSRRICGLSKIIIDAIFVN